MTETFVRYETDGKIGFITLARPAKLNAINQVMKQQIIDTFALADQDPSTSVIVLRAEGRSFCVGFDIGNNPGRDERRDDPRRWDASMHKSLDMALAPWRNNKLTIASVQGHVLGGGCELAMMCDMTVAADNATFGEPEVRFAHLGPVLVMPWIIGLKRAREILLSGDTIDAKTALNFGMVNRVVPLAELEDATLKFAKRYALIAPEALKWGKRAINRGAEIGGFRAAIEAGAEALTSLWTIKTDTGVEFDKMVMEKGLKAALEWRSNQFKE